MTIAGLGSLLHVCSLRSRLTHPSFTSVTAVISIVGQVAHARNRSPGPVPLHYARFSTAYFSMSLATALITSALITWRVILAQRAVRSADGGVRFERSYARLIEIIVESAAMYSANLLVFVILSSTRNPNVEYTQQIQPQISVRLQLSLNRTIDLLNAGPRTDLANLPCSTRTFSPGYRMVHSHVIQRGDGVQ